MANPGVLLLHGFTSHRSSLEALIPALEERGLEWHYPMLAGHGTTPHDLKDKRWHHWQNDAEQAYRYLRQAHGQVVIIALSMGSLLALELASVHQPHVAGLVLLAPCLRFYSKLSKYTPVVSRLMGHFPNPHLKKHSHVRYAIKDKGYPWFPTATFRSYWERTRQMTPIIQAVRCPVRIIQPRRDMIADPRGAQEIYDLLTGPRELLWHEKSGHELLMDAETPEVIQEIMEFPPLQVAR